MRQQALAPTIKRHWLGGSFAEAGKKPHHSLSVSTSKVVVADREISMIFLVADNHPIFGSV
jgi:hypothetical protein